MKYTRENPFYNRKLVYCLPVGCQLEMSHLDFQILPRCKKDCTLKRAHLKYLISENFSPDVAVITNAKLHSNKSELRFWAGSNPALGVAEIRDGGDL